MAETLGAAEFADTYLPDPETGLIHICSGDIDPNFIGDLFTPVYEAVDFASTSVDQGTDFIEPI